MITIVVSVIIKDKRLLKKNVCFITIPAILLGTVIFAVIYNLGLNIWYYRIDAVVGAIIFYFIMILCLLNMQIYGVRLKTIVKNLICPIIFGSALYMFAKLYLRNRYMMADNTEKFLIRVIYYPLIVESSLLYQEYSYRTFDDGTLSTVHGRAHFVFLSQVSFGILGRYLTTIAGSLWEVALFSFLIFLKDILLHRMSWLQCYLAHKVKNFLGMSDSEEDFNNWFYSPSFQEFRGCVFNNDFIHEITGKWTQSNSWSCVKYRKFT